MNFMQEYPIYKFYGYLFLCLPLNLLSNCNVLSFFCSTREPFVNNDDMIMLLKIEKIVLFYTTNKNMIPISSITSL